MPLPDGEKSDSTCTCFDTIPEYDGWTDRWTERQISHNNIELHRQADADINLVQATPKGSLWDSYGDPA